MSNLKEDVVVRLKTYLPKSGFGTQEYPGIPPLVSWQDAMSSCPGNSSPLQWKQFAFVLEIQELREVLVHGPPPKLPVKLPEVEFLSWK